MGKTIAGHFGARASKSNRSAFSRAGRFGRIPPKDVELRMDLQNWSCLYCKDKITLFTCELDHVNPLAGGGEHYLYNIVLACRTCNNTKRARSLKRFCKVMNFDLEAIRQEIAELNFKQHCQTDFEDEYQNDALKWAI